MFPVGDFSCLLRVFGYANLLFTVDCTPAWYNVTKAFIRDANRFRSYYATQDTALCLGLECPRCAELPTNSDQHGVYTIIIAALSQ